MRYKEYKKVDLPWLEEVPSHWEIKNINNLFDERREKVSDKDYPPLSVTKNGILPQLENVAKSMASDNRKKVLKGDFVINSRSDRKGSSGLSSYDGSVSLISTVIKPRLGFNKFWHYLLKSNDFIEEFYRNGKGIVADLWTTNFQSMKSIILPFPPKEEQEQIARFLDWKINEIDRLILLKNDKVKKLDKNVQLLIDESIASIKNYDEIKLKNLGTFLKNGNLSRNDKEESSKFSALLYGDLYTKYNYIFDEAQTKINKKSYYDNPIINGNTLFFTTSGETREEIGKCVLYTGEEEIAIGGDLVVFKAYNKVNSKYLMYALNTSDAINYRYVNARGEIIIHISQVSLGNYKIRVPQVSIQEEISIKIEENIRNNNVIREKVEKQINNLKQLKQSLISDVVTGKIDVRKVDIPYYDKVSDVVEESILEENFNGEV